MYDHIGLKVKDLGASARIYESALAALGLCADYSPTYYAAFLIDPDGNNVEAVCLD